VVGLRGRDAERAFRAAGLNSILAFDGVTFGGQLITRLTLFGGVAGSLNTVDLVEPRSVRYGAQILARSLETTLRDERLSVVLPEDFIILKILATRDRDLEDAISVSRLLAGRLDMELVKRELDDLGAEIADYDMKSRWSALQAALQR
jgi:hypothetical protein